MKIASFILTALLGLLALSFSYELTKCYIDNGSANKSVLLTELEWIPIVLGYLLLFGFSFFLTKRTRYLENMVLFICALLFVVVDNVVKHYVHDLLHHLHLWSK